MARLVLFVLAQAVLSSSAARENEKNIASEAILSSLAAREEDQDVVGEQVEIIPSDQVLQGVSIANAEAEANEMRMKLLVAQAEVAVVEAERARDEKQKALDEVLAKDKIHLDMLRKLVEAIDAADQQLEEAETVSAEKQDAAETKLANVNDEVKAAQKYLKQRKRYLDTAIRQGEQNIREQEINVKNTMQWIMSFQESIAQKSANVDVATHALNLTIAQRARQTRATDAELAAAMEELETAENDADDVVARARAAKEKAEQELSAVKTSTGGKALVSAHADQMLAEAKRAQTTAREEYARAMKMKTMASEWQTKVDGFYRELTQAESFLSQYSHLFWRRFQRESVSITDSVVARKIALVDADQATNVIKDVVANEVAILAMANEFTSALPGVSEHIKEAVEEIQLKTVEMANPLSKWYVLAVKNSASAGADAYEVFKADLESGTV